MSTETLRDRMKSNTPTAVGYSEVDSENDTPTRTLLNEDSAHDLLSNTRRRSIVDALPERGSIAKSDLIDSVAQAEHTSPSENERKCIQVSMHQSHLPKLEDYGVIVSSGDGYARGPAFDALVSYRRPETLADTFRHVFRIVRR